MKRLAVPVLALAAVLLAPRLAHAAACNNQFDNALDQGWVWAFLASFGWGFLTSLTPCVYPMIPIVVGIFGARDEAVTRRRAFLLASSYVAGMGLLFAVLGVVFALVGKQSGTGSLLANPYVVVPMVLLYLALSASMFGAFEINLPSGLQNRLNRVGGRGFAGAFALGMVGGLTAAPCTGPFLAGILGFVASTGNAVAGGSLLFTFALGMGVLFFVLAVFAVSLPKSGRWMESVKSIGGVALLGAALYFVRPLVPPLRAYVWSESWFLYGSLAVAVAGIALGAIHLSFHAGWGTRLRKGFAVALTLTGLIGAVNYAVTPNRHLPWRHDEAQAFADAKAAGKGVMIDFSAKWCLPCGELENTFAADSVFERLVAGYVPLKFDVTAGSDEDDDRQERYHAQTLPAVVFMAPGGNELGRVDKFMPPDEFLRALDAAERGVDPAEKCE